MGLDSDDDDDTGEHLFEQLVKLSQPGEVPDRSEYYDESAVGTLMACAATLRSRASRTRRARQASLTCL